MWILKIFAERVWLQVDEYICIFNILDFYNHLSIYTIGSFDNDLAVVCCVPPVPSLVNPCFLIELLICVNLGYAIRTIILGASEHPVHFKLEIIRTIFVFQHAFIKALWWILVITAYWLFKIFRDATDLFTASVAFNAWGCISICYSWSLILVD